MDLVAANGLRPARLEMMERKHVFDTNLQKELLSEHKRDSKNNSQEYAKFLVYKKALITILFGQYDESTKTEIALGATYAADRQAGRVIKFLKRLHKFVLVMMTVAYHTRPKGTL